MAKEAGHKAGRVGEMNHDAAAVVDRGEFMRIVWLVCVEEGGLWVPRQDLPPAFDEVIAEAFAREQTVICRRRLRTPLAKQSTTRRMEGDESRHRRSPRDDGLAV